MAVTYFQHLPIKHRLILEHVLHYLTEILIQFFQVMICRGNHVHVFMPILNLVKHIMFLQGIIIITIQIIFHL